LDYIKNFEWKEMIYSKKKSLAELCALITKVRFEMIADDADSVDL